MSSVTSTSNNLNDNTKILVSVLHAKEALEEMSNMEHMDSMCRMEHMLLRKHSILTFVFVVAASKLGVLGSI